MNTELPSDVTPKIQPSELTSEIHTQCLDIGKTGNVFGELWYIKEE